jgi:hypothetical protein
MRPAVIAPACCLIYVIALVVGAGDPFVLVTLGEQFAPAELRGHEYSPTGYDGQFAYYLARYGLDASPYLDVPAYRAQRVLLPFLGWLLSFGQPALLIWSLLLVNLCALAAGTHWLEELLMAHGANRWVALGFALSLGMFGAVRMTTTETLAYGLAAGALHFANRERWLAAAVIFGLAGLAKETTLLFPAGCALYLLLRNARMSIVLTMIAWAPWVIWQGVLSVTYGEIGVGSGGANTTGFELIPFMGIVRPVVQAVHGSNLETGIVLAALLGLFVVTPALWGLGQVVVRMPSFARWPLVNWILATNVAVIPFIPASTLAEPLGIFRVIVGFQLTLIVFAAEHGLTRALTGTTFWAATTLLMAVTDLRSIGR